MALELLGVEIGTERTILVLEKVGKGPLTLSPKAKGQRSIVMSISPDGVSKRVSGRENPEEAQSVHGALTVFQASCYSLIILLDPHPYDVDILFPFCT